MNLTEAGSIESTMNKHKSYVAEEKLSCHFILLTCYCDNVKLLILSFLINGMNGAIYITCNPYLIYDITDEYCLYIPTIN